MIDQQVIYYVNNQRQGSRSYLSRNNLGGVTIAVLDSVSLIPMSSSYVGIDPITGLKIGTYGNYHAPVTDDLNYFEYPMEDSAFRARFVEFIDNILDNQYIVIYTVDDNHYDLWEPEVKQRLTDLGANLIPQLSNHVPYGLILRKGDPAFVPEEVLGANASDIIQVNKLISSPFFSGNFESTLIGPSSGWNNVLWDFETDNTLGDLDTTQLSIIGVRSNRSESVIRTNVATINEDISDIDHNEFPYLKLKIDARDDDLFTPGQLGYWRVLHEGIPEAIISPIDFYVFESDTIPQGREVSIEIAARNISDVDMDSLLVKYTIFDNINNTIELGTRRHRNLPGGDTLITSLSFTTEDLSGNNTLIIEINPDNDQFEQFHFNNFAFIPFFVLTDNTNPLLDVTFDGVHILDGDIVSPTPFIKMDLKDENKFLALEDTSLINVFISDPNGQLTRIPFDNEIMMFFPADQANVAVTNRASIEYRPTFMQDGIYKLIVQARDASNNLSGLNDYKTKFEIINKSMISNLINYPNPFTTSTQFVFTLTGSIIPSQLKIQIMTVTGKVVREITMDELGPIHIGRNVTQFAWDGTDMYGDRLANGVYFYRVVTSKPDYNFEHFETGTEQFFKEGIGKMYLMR